MPKKNNSQFIAKFKFKPGQSGNPAGRPRKYVSTLKGIGYKLSEINDTLQNFMALNESEIKEIEKNKDCTILERIVAGALLQSHKKKSMYNIETILTRAFGKPADQKLPEPPPPEKKIIITSIDPVEAAREYQNFMD